VMMPGRSVHVYFAVYLETLYISSDVNEARHYEAKAEA